ncbi:hypothetical protein OSTOST_04132, partial [Ostertagia ostertagi]
MEQQMPEHDGEVFVQDVEVERAGLAGAEVAERDHPAALRLAGRQAGGGQQAVEVAAGGQGGVGLHDEAVPAGGRRLQRQRGEAGLGEVDAELGDAGRRAVGMQREGHPPVRAAEPFIDGIDAGGLRGTASQRDRAHTTGPFDGLHRDSPVAQPCPRKTGRFGPAIRGGSADRRGRAGRRDLRAVGRRVALAHDDDARQLLHLHLGRLRLGAAAFDDDAFELDDFFGRHVERHPRGAGQRDEGDEDGGAGGLQAAGAGAGGADAVHVYGSRLICVALCPLRLGGITDLNLLADIKPGFVDALEVVTYVDRLRKVLRTLNGLRLGSRESSAPASPYTDIVARWRIVHSFRWSIVDGKDGAPDRLLLSVNFDGGWEPYMRVIWDQLGSTLDLMLCHTENYTLSRDCSFETYARWVREHEVSADFLFIESGRTLRFPAAEPGENFTAADDKRLKELADALTVNTGLALMAIEPMRSNAADKEHFGFKDGISQPTLAGTGTPGQAWDDQVKTGEVLQGFPTERDKGYAVPEQPDALLDRGSFLVVRKLRQYTGRFSKRTYQEAKKIGLDHDLVLAKLMGRWQDGRPLAAPETPGAGNDFNYAKDAQGSA